MMTPLAPAGVDWSRWGSPLDRKRDVLFRVLRAQGEAADGAAILKLPEAAVDAELAKHRVRVWASGGLGHVGGVPGAPR